MSHSYTNMESGKWLENWSTTATNKTVNTTGSTFTVTGEWRETPRRDKWSQMLRDKALDAEGYEYKERIAQTRSGWLPIQSLKNL